MIAWIQGSAIIAMRQGTCHVIAPTPTGALVVIEVGLSATGLLHSLTL